MGLCFSTVDQGTVQIIERFGKFDRVAFPGFNCLIPCLGEGVAGVLSMRVQELQVRCETKTKDDVFVNIHVSVQYQVLRDNVYDAFYKLTDSNSQIRSYVYDVIRASVPRMELDHLFTSKEEIEQDVKTELMKNMGSFGFVIIQAPVTEIEPAYKVKEAMNEINAASRQKLAAVQKAEADKVKVVKAAEAEAEAKFLAGQGIARQRQAIINGLRESVMAFSHDVSGVNSKEVMEMMMITQYFDMLKDVGQASKGTTMFLPHQPGAVSDVTEQIRATFSTTGPSKK